MKKKKALDLVAFVLSKVGKAGYWYGTFGRMGTQSLLDATVKRNPGKMYTHSYIARCKKWIGKHVTDCIGLIKWFMWGDDYVASQDVGADTMRSMCNAKSIGSIPEDPGVLVFMNGHVGVYVGKGYVVESRGADYGVVKTKLKDRPWTHWGYCPWIDYSKSEKKCRELKINDVGEDVKELQRELNKHGADLRVNGDFDLKTKDSVIAFQAKHKLKKDGVVGPETRKELY